MARAVRRQLEKRQPVEAATVRGGGPFQATAPVVHQLARARLLMMLVLVIVRRTRRDPPVEQRVQTGDQTRIALAHDLFAPQCRRECGGATHQVEIEIVAHAVCRVRWTLRAAQHPRLVQRRRFQPRNLEHTPKRGHAKPPSMPLVVEVRARVDAYVAQRAADVEIAVDQAVTVLSDIERETNLKQVRQQHFGVHGVLHGQHVVVVAGRVLSHRDLHPRGRHVRINQRVRVLRYRRQIDQRERRCPRLFAETAKPGRQLSVAHSRIVVPILHLAVRLHPQIAQRLVHHLDPTYRFRCWVSMHQTFQQLRLLRTMEPLQTNAQSFPRQLGHQRLLLDPCDGGSLLRAASDHDLPQLGVCVVIRRRIETRAHAHQCKTGLARYAQSNAFEFQSVCQDLYWCGILW